MTSLARTMHSTFQTINTSMYNTYIFSIWVQLLDRRQQRLDLILLSLSNFTEVLPMYDNDNSNIHLGGPIVQVLYTEVRL